MMDIDQLQSVRDRERSTDDLQELRESFYADATSFIRDLRAERAAAAEAVDDPFDSPRVIRLTDRIRTAEQTLEAIYEKRVGKVLKAATFAAADLPAEAEGMTAEEAALFETLVAEIRANREAVLGDLAEDESDIPDPGDLEPTDSAEVITDGPSDERATDQDAGGGREPASTMGESDAGGAGEPASTMEESDADGRGEDGNGDDGADGVDRELVRITDDVGEILGVDDREYDLAAGEVVTLPAANARPLIEQGAAERLE